MFGHVDGHDDGYSTTGRSDRASTDFVASILSYRFCIFLSNMLCGVVVSWALRWLIANLKSARKWKATSVLINAASGPTPSQCHARSESHGGAESEQETETGRAPTVLDLLSSSSRPVEDHMRQKAPCPVSVYGERPEPEPHSVSYGQPAYEEEQLSPPQSPAFAEIDPRDAFEADFAHTEVVSQSSIPHLHSPRSPSHQFYPLTPLQQDRFEHQSSPLAKHNQSAYFQNSTVEQPYATLGRSEIRLIRILPQTSGPLKLTFMYTSIENPPPYTALSYTWGYSRAKINIDLNGHQMLIAPNLYDALRKLQSRDRDVLCWADAVCINQQDKSEVTKQVMLMSLIYGFASSVAVWLGPSSSDSDEAIKLLCQIRKHGNDGYLRSLIKSPDNHSGFRAIVNLFEREYWGRVWVIQEVLNAKYVTVHCGLSTLPWSTYQKAADILRECSPHIDQHFSSWSQSANTPLFVSPKTRLSYSDVFTKLGPASFREMQRLLDEGSELSSIADARRFFLSLCECRSRLTSDPKDKVYGLLGILPVDVQSRFTPDYTKSVREIYLEAAKYIITTTKSLSLVCHAFHFPVHLSSTGLPTWVPDWSHISPMAPISGPMGQFSAGSDKSEDITVSDNGVLGIDAIYIDEVQYRGTAMNTVENDDDLVVAFLHWFAILQQRIKGFHGLSTEGVEEIEDKLCRVIALDNVHPMFTAPGAWRNVTFHAFASMAIELLPEMPLHHRLAEYTNDETLKETGIDRDVLVQEIFSKGMIGRSFFITRNGIMGLGSGFLAAGDAVVVPLGCSTPIMLRPDGEGGQYRFVGDAFVDGFMYGRALAEWREGRGDVVRYEIH